MESPAAIESVRIYRQKESDRLIASAGISEKFAHFDIDALRDNPGLFSIIEKYIEQYDTKRGYGLYLWGSIGS